MQAATDRVACVAAPQQHQPPPPAKGGSPHLPRHWEGGQRRRRTASSRATPVLCPPRLPPRHRSPTRHVPRQQQQRPEEMRTSCRQQPAPPLLLCQTSYRHGVNYLVSRSHAMCTGICLIARVADARLTYAEYPVSRTSPACPRGRITVCARSVPACRVRSCGVGGRRESERRPGCRESVHIPTGGRRPLVVLIAAGRNWGVCERVGACRAGLRCVCALCGVGHAWTLGLVRRPVALSGLLLLWPSGTLGSWCVNRWWITETLLTMHTLRVSRS